MPFFFLLHYSSKSVQTKLPEHVLRLFSESHFPNVQDESVSLLYYALVWMITTFLHLSLFSNSLRAWLHFTGFFCLS